MPDLDSGDASPSRRIRELPEDERPRERLLRSGADALGDAELIAILLRTGRQGANAVEVARELLARFGSCDGIARATVPQLAAVKGVGPAKALQLCAAFGLAVRLARQRIARQPLNEPRLVEELLGAEMRLLDRESLRAVLLDTRHRLLRVEEISLGSLNESIAHPREIFRAAVQHAAAAFILVHNHPSGDTSPSEADHRLTRRLAEASRILQIPMLDHVIIGLPRGGQPGYFSFREAGVL